MYGRYMGNMYNFGGWGGVGVRVRNPLKGLDSLLLEDNHPTMQFVMVWIFHKQGGHNFLKYLSYGTPHPKP